MRAGARLLAARRARARTPRCASPACAGSRRTFDEPTTCRRGWVSWTLGDHRMNPDHPPLREAWRPRRCCSWTSGWTGRPRLAREPAVGVRQAVPLPLERRRPAALLGPRLDGRCSAARWPRRCSPGRGGSGACPRRALALFLYVLNPDMLAHGQIVANDLGTTLFLFLAVVAFERLTERVTRGAWRCAAWRSARALATKFSGLACCRSLGALAVAAVALARAAARGAPGAAGTGARRAPGEPRRVLARCSCSRIAVVARLVLGGLRLPLAACAGPRRERRLRLVAHAARDAVVARAFALARRLQLLPDAWTYSASCTSSTTRRRARPSCSASTRRRAGATTSWSRSR